jgi:homotetrameric cytidine deaminase
VDDPRLLDEAKRAASHAHAPYSGLQVGAAVLTRDGRVFTGANVENASYGLSLCAERAALACAASHGVKPGEVEAVAATASPCGACRQWLQEFRVDRVVFPWDGGTAVRTLADLLPDSFTL